MPAYRSTTPKVKDAKFIREYVKHGNGTQAAMVAYSHKRTTAQSMAYQKLRQPAIRDAIQQALINQGITAEWLIEKRKVLVNHGMSGLLDGSVKMQASDIQKNLEGLERMMIDKGKSSGNSLHLHMDVKPLAEVKAHAKELDSYFKGILEDGELVE